jgi:formate/nitrite transporter FocA (FNT family)
MYLITIAWLAGTETITWAGFVRNLVPVTLGNTVGGGVFGAAIYWLIYLRKPQAA